MSTGHADTWRAGAPRDRLVAMAGVVAVHLAVGWLLFSGLAPDLVHRTEQAMQVFNVQSPPPPRPIARPARNATDPRRRGAAAPANKRSTPTEIVAPVVPPPPIPPPIPAAPIAGIDAAPTAGAAPVPGPGTGGGGSGIGTGSGGPGDGQGGGGRGTFAQQIAGRIYGSDYPKAALRAGIGGTVWVRYTVTVRGRVKDCRVTRSSGNADLDTTTCRLVTKYFRYRPGTDATGRTIPSTIEEDHHWITETRRVDPDDAPPPGDDR